jgi:uncharacterized membrane protein
MTRKTFAWLGMTVLAIGVAGYALTILSIPEFRPPFARTLFETSPVDAFTHFLSGAIALVAGAFQLNAWLRTRFIGAHRWLGQLYVIAVIAGGVTGFLMALHAFGGLASHVGFGLLAVLWMGTTLNAYRHIKQRDLIAHRTWMIRSYALTLAAVTLRLYLTPSLMLGFPMQIAYPVIAWLCWVPNLLVAEWFVRSRHASAMLPNDMFGPKVADGPAPSG